MPFSNIDYQEKIAYTQKKANKVAIGEGEHSRTTLWCVLPEQGIKPHVHAGDHIWVVMEGAGNYLNDEGAQPIAPGQVLIIPAGLSHGVENTGSEGLVFLSISTQ